MSAKPGPSWIGSYRTTTLHPENSTQETIQAIWQNGLGITEIGIHDNFFKLGGHSLLLTQLASRVKKELEANPKVSALFDKPTIAEWAEFSDASRMTGNERHSGPGKLKRLSRERFRTSSVKQK